MRASFSITLFVFPAYQPSLTCHNTRDTAAVVNIEDGLGNEGRYRQLMNLVVKGMNLDGPGGNSR
jgi:hypothetical protein